MALKVSNNASSTLAGSLAAIDTTLSVATAEGARFPTLGAGDWFPLTLVKLVAGVPTIEIVKVTARAGDVLTVVRAQEGTTGLTFSAGDRAELRLTAAALAEFALSSDLDALALVVTDKAGTVANTFTGKQTGTEVSMANYIDKTVTNATAAGAVTLDFDLGDVFDLTLSGNTTLALSNLPTLSGETFTFKVGVTQGGTAYTLTWFGSITWLTTGGTAPAAPAINKTIEYVLSTKDGTNFTGRKGASN